MLFGVLSALRFQGAFHIVALTRRLASTNLFCTSLLFILCTSVQLSLIQANATDEQSVLRAVKEATEANGIIHILVANHGVFPSRSVPLWELDRSQWERTLAINLTGTFLFCKAFCLQIRDHIRREQNANSADSYHESEREGFDGRAVGERRTGKGKGKQFLCSRIILIGSTAGIFGEVLLLSSNPVPFVAFLPST